MWDFVSENIRQFEHQIVTHVLLQLQILRYVTLTFKPHALSASILFETFLKPTALTEDWAENSELFFLSHTE